MLDRLKEWAKAAKSETIALYFCMRDPRVPWYAKAVALLVVTYALSPIDLIPDFIPIVGYLDDIILVPLGIMLAIRLMPPAILEEHRRRAAAWQGTRPVSKAGAFAVLAVWFCAIVLAAYLLGSRMANWLNR